MEELKLVRHPETNEIIPETWKDVEGYEGKYEVSNYGRIKSKLSKEDKILKPSKGVMGYTRVNLQGNVKRIHTLVAKAFIPNPDNKPTVNHKDLDKTNNFLNNLEWATYKENNNHARENGVIFKTAESIRKQRLKILGSKHPRSKLDESQVVYIKHLIKNTRYSQSEIARAYDISPQTICDIKMGRQWGWL